MEDRTLLRILDKLDSSAFSSVLCGFMSAQRTAANDDEDLDSVLRGWSNLAEVCGLQSNPGSIEKYDLTRLRWSKEEVACDSEPVTRAGQCDVPAYLCSNGVARMAPEDLKSIGDALFTNSLRQKKEEFIVALTQYRGASAARKGSKLDLNCGVLPHPDTLAVPALLNLIRSDIEKAGWDLRFVAQDLKSLRKDIGDTKDSGNTICHIGYTPSGYIDKPGKKKNLHFREMRTGDTQMIALVHEDAPFLVADGTGASSSMAGTAYNFQGSYVTKGADRSEMEYEQLILEFDYFKESIGKRTDARFNVDTISNSGEIESLLTMALATRKMNPRHIVIPTLQGYVWACQAGLVRHPFDRDDKCQGTGTLRPALIHNTLDSGSLGFYTKRIGKKSKHENVAHTLLALVEGFESFVWKAFSGDELGPTELMQVYVSPIFEADHPSAGIWRKIPPDLFLKMAIPYEARGLARSDGTVLYGNEVYFVPKWFSSFRDAWNECGLGEPPEGGKEPETDDALSEIQAQESK